MKRSVAVLLLACLCALPLCACAAQKSMENMASGEAVAPGAAEGGYYDAADGAMWKETPPPVQAAPEDYERKTIRDASLELESRDVTGLYEQMNSYAESLGGYEFTNEIRNDGDKAYATIVWKLPPERLDDFLRFAGEKGTLTASRLNSEDITDAYYDAETRLNTLRRTLEQYYSLLERAVTIEDIVYVQQVIDGIVSDIESYEGKLSMWNQLTAMATVYVTIRHQTDPSDMRREIDWNALSLDDMGYLIQSGAVAVGSTVVTVLQWIVIVLAVGSPLWITLALVFFLLLRKRRRKRSCPPEDAEREKAGTD